MKRLLFTLCVALLSFVGAQAQQAVDVTISTIPDNTITIIKGGADGTLSGSISGSTWAYQVTYSNSNDGVCSVSQVLSSSVFPLTIKGLSIGTSTITITATKNSSAQYNPGPETKTKTVTVNVVPPPLTLTATAPSIVRMGDGSQSVNLSVAEATSYTKSFQSLNAKVLTVDANGIITPVGVGNTGIKVTATPSDLTKYSAATTTVYVSVKRSEFGLSITGTSTIVDGVNGGTVTITPTVTLNGTTTTSYNNLITYSLRGTYTGVSVDSNGKVTVASGAPAQAVTVVATLTPTDTTTHTKALATTGFVITDNNSGQVTMTNSGSTVTINFPKAGLWNNITDTPAISGSSTATLTDLKNATEVKVTGLVSSADIREIAHLIGSDGSFTSRNATTLDMGEAQLVEALNVKNQSNQYDVRIQNIETLILPKPAPFATIVPELALWVGQNGTGKLKYLGITEGWTGISPRAFETCIGLEDAYFPATLVTIGEYAFNNCMRFQTIDMKKCTLVEQIDQYAFAQGYEPTNPSGVGAKVLNLPPNLKIVKEGAFNHHSQKILWIPKYVERIEKYAFSDFNGNTPMSDVFFVGTLAPTYVDKEAFSQEAQYANNGTVDFNSVQDNGTADRDVYKAKKSGTTVGYCTVMHFPEGCDAEYLDTSRVYESRGRTEKGSDPSGSTPDAKVSYIPDGYEVYKAATGNYPSYTPINGGYPDIILGEDLVWPSEGQMQGAYAMAHNGYFWDGTKMNQAELDKQGLYQFVLAFGDCPSEKFAGYESPDKWYTICLAYDMPVAEIYKTFGDKTQVCRISKVLRGVPAEGDEENVGVWLYFQRSVMETNGYGPTPDANKYSEIAYDTLYTNTDTGIKAYYSYMIKPSGIASNQVIDEKGNLIRVFPDFQQYYKPGAMRRDSITALTIKAGESTLSPSEYKYTFVGTHKKVHLQQYSYFLGRQTQTGKHQLFFYTGTTEQGADRWKANTSVVRPSNGKKDKDDFFGGTQKAKLMTLFGFDKEEDVPTGIKEVNVNADKNIDSKIYSVSGQYVGTSLENLPKGLYIVGGKKYIVR